MRLYGVEHAAHMAATEIGVIPNEGMIDDIQQLPAGSVVALETTPEIIPSHARASFDYPEKTVAYWLPLIEACEARGHKLVHLDSLELQLMAAATKEARQALIAKLKGQPESAPSDPVEEMLAREEIFALDAVAKHTHGITREAVVFDNLAGASADIAVISANHADYLVATPEEQARRGLNIEDYLRVSIDPDELPPLEMWASVIARSSPHPIHQYISGNFPEQRSLAVREAIVRAHRAATTGRILPNGRPFYVGTWQPLCRTDGLFELYPDAHLVGPSWAGSGTIEDTLGTARFEGEFRPAGVRFEKRYDPKLSSDETIDETIIYEAERSSDDEYRGEWRAEGGKAKGEFVLRKASAPFEPSLVRPLNVMAEIEQRVKQLLEGQAAA